MKYGFVRVAAAIPIVKVADCKFNAQQIETQIAIADGKGVQIIIFPELSITGYTCADLFGQSLLLEEAEMALMQIMNNTRQMDIVSIIGMPVVMNSTLLNSAVIFQKGKILGIVPKTYLPNYKEFYEQRWFTSALNHPDTNIRLCGQNVPVSANLLFSTLPILASALKSAKTCGRLFRPALHWHCKERKSYSICRPTMKE